MGNMVLPGSYVLLNGLFLLLLAARTAVTRVIDKENSETVAKTQDGSDLFKVPFKLEETYTADFLPYNFNGTWRTNSLILYTSAITADILLFDVTTQRSIRIVDASELMLSDIFKDKLEIVDISLSPTARFLLIGHDRHKVFRYSTLMRCVVYDIKERKFYTIGNDAYITLAKWTPKTDDLVYVHDNDIYHRSFSSEDGNYDVQRLTDNGIVGVIYNGVPDWVYEEEVFHGASAIWFSPSGGSLVYATFDDRNVKEISYPHYGQPGSLKDQYPTEMKLKYPKPGTPNPVVSLTMINLNEPIERIDLKAPIDAIGSDNVMVLVQWEDINNIVVTWTNRIQNKAQVVWYDRSGEIIKTIDLVEDEGWLDMKQLLFHNGAVFMRKLQPSGTAAGRFHHVTRFDDVGGQTPTETDLTPGPSEVQAMLSIDYGKGRLYYLASVPGQPSQRHLYSVPVDGSKEPTCISCDVVTPEGNSCTYADATFSTHGSYYVLTCQGPDPMFVSIFNSDHQKVYTWQDNLSLRRKLADRELPLVMNLYVRVNGYESKVKLFLPHNFDETKSYPMLVNVYAGPNTAQITDTASVGFSTYMATNRSVIYAYIDGRGSSNKGSKMLFEIYRSIGTVEIEDQISVTRYLQETYPWIDSKRTGIWGWSYGGFSTAMILAKDTASVFKCGVSVAPVSSWIYYDSIYTERYMGLPTPEDNLHGYNETDVSRRVEGIRGKKYLLVHGTGDDNVHYQQSLALAKALEMADILFQQITYTDESHALLGVLPHLYHTMDRFWSDCFSLPRVY